MCDPDLQVVVAGEYTYICLAVGQFITGVSKYTLDMAVNGVDIFQRERKGKIATEPGQVSTAVDPLELLREKMVVVPLRPRYDMQDDVLKWEGVLDNAVLKKFAEGNSWGCRHTLTVKAHYTYKEGIIFGPLEVEECISTYMRGNGHEHARVLGRVIKRIGVLKAEVL